MIRKEKSGEIKKTFSEEYQENWKYYKIFDDLADGDIIKVKSLIKEDISLILAKLAYNKETNIYLDQFKK